MISKRKKPCQHIRKLKSGKKILVNKGVKRRRSFYNKSAFKRALDVATPEERKELQNILTSVPVVGSKKETDAFINAFKEKIDSILETHTPKTRIGEKVKALEVPREFDEETEARREAIKKRLGIQKEKIETPMEKLKIREEDDLIL